MPRKKAAEAAPKEAPVEAPPEEEPKAAEPDPFADIDEADMWGDPDDEPPWAHYIEDQPEPAEPEPAPAEPVVLDSVTGWTEEDEKARLAASEEQVPGQRSITGVLSELESSLEAVEAVAPTVDQVLDVVKADGHEYFGPTLGTAEFVGQYEDGSPEWHEARTKGIGGSESASILGINNFCSAYRLWHMKRGIWLDDNVESEILIWGHLQEPAIAARFEMLHPEFEVLEGGSWRKSDAPWMLANPDRFLVNRDTGEVRILEIKTSEYGTGWDFDRCPAKYVVQVRHYLHVFGLDYGYLVVKIGNSDYREFLVPADPTQKIEKLHGGTVKPSSFIIEYGHGPTLEASAKNFLELPEPPAMDGNVDIYEGIRASNPSLDKGVEVELPVMIGTMLLESKAALSKAESEHQEARNHVMAHMGTAQYAKYNDARVASRVAKSGAAPYLKVS